MNAFNDAVRAIYEPADLGQFPHRLVATLSRLIGGSFSIYEESNLARGRSLGIADPFHARETSRLHVFDHFDTNTR